MTPKTKVKDVEKEETKMMFKLMEYDYLTEDEEKTVISMESQFLSRGYLTKPQKKFLKDIFDNAAGRVQWSR